MTGKIKIDRQIGVTAEIDDNLKIAAEFTGMTISQYGRLAILEKLVRDGFMVHPMMNRAQNSPAKSELQAAE